MPHFIDRRLNPKGKSLANRQRFLRRARGADQARRCDSPAQGPARSRTSPTSKKISIPTKGTREPRFRHARDTAASASACCPATRSSSPAIRSRSRQGGGGGGGGKEALGQRRGRGRLQLHADRARRSSTFSSRISSCPTWSSCDLKEITTFKPRRAGFTTSGSPDQHQSRAHDAQSVRPPHRAAAAASSDEIEALADGDRRAGGERDAEPRRHARSDRRAARRARACWSAGASCIAFIDPLDVRFNRFEQQPEPTSQAVMFCLMDVSGSMGEREKDLAKRFFMLLHLFLKRRYERIDIVFIRHTHEAQEVDEETFFYSTRDRRHDRFDGARGDAARSSRSAIRAERVEHLRRAGVGRLQRSRAMPRAASRCLNEEMMPICQYYAYIEILDEREMEVFRTDERHRAVARLSRASPRHGRISRRSASPSRKTSSPSSASCSPSSAQQGAREWRA